MASPSLTECVLRKTSGRQLFRVLKSHMQPDQPMIK